MEKLVIGVFIIWVVVVLGSVAFVGWVTIKLLQHFGII